MIYKSNNNLIYTLFDTFYIAISEIQKSIFKSFSFYYLLIKANTDESIIQLSQKSLKIKFILTLSLIIL